MELDLTDMAFFSHPSGGFGKKVIIFGIDMSSSTKIGKIIGNKLS